MDSFDSLLTCCICLDRYRNPKLLPCQHTFCMEPCMEGLIDYVKRQVKCPECRAEHRIPYKGIQEFPSNVTMQRFLEMYQAISGELPDPNQGRVMERCSICNEKEYLQPCAHCDKKICSDCKSAHVDVLKREVVRINNQVRRGLHKLYDILSQVEKNAGTVQQNCTSVQAEVDSLSERLIEAVRHRTEVLKGEVDAHMAAEVRSLNTLKTNLEQEISNIESNSELAEKHISDQTEWDDCELMDAKDIFLKTVEFIRNFEQEAPTSGDFRRPIRFSAAQDPNLLHRTLEHFGELNITKNALTDGNSITNGNNNNNGYSLMHSSSSAGPGLMRSKSDHRLVSQLRQQEERYGDESGRSSPVARRRFGDRAAGRRDSEVGLGDDTGGYDAPCERRHKYRSRFTRRNLDVDDDLDGYRPEPTPASRDEVAREKKKEREKVLDTDDASRGPISGITRIADVPRVIQKLAEAERGPRKRPEPASAPAEPAHAPAHAQPVPWRRQRSEEDEISKIKKQNKEADARCSRGGATAAAVAEESPPSRGASVSRTSAERRTSSQPSTPTSTLQRSRLSREESGSETEDSTRRRPSRVSRPSAGAPISEGAHEPPDTRRAPLAAPQRKISEPARVGSPRTAQNLSRSSSGGSLNAASLEPPRLAPLRNTWERRISRSNSSESTSSDSSTNAQPKPTGAAFSTSELKNRFMRGGAPPPPPETPRGRYSASGASTSLSSRPPASGGATADSASSSSHTPARPRFQSRFLGRAGTPKAEGSKESSSSSGSSESESESSDSESDSDNAPTGSFRSRANDKMAKTSIGPLLARSAHARASGMGESASPAASPTTTVPSSRLTRPSSLSSSYSSRRDSAAGEYTPSAAASSSTDRYTSRYGGVTDTSPTSTEPKPYEPSRYSTGASRYSSSDYTPGTGLVRSRTSSHLDSRSSGLDSPDTYSPYTSKYSRPSRSSAYDDYTPPSRYSSYSSRFLNRGEGSAALEEPEQAATVRLREATAAAACPDPTAPVAGGGRAGGTSPYAPPPSEGGSRRGGRARSTSSDEAGERGSSDARSLRLPAPRQDSDSDTSAASGEAAQSVVPAAAGSKSEALSSWAQHLKNKYGYNTDKKGREKTKGVRRSKSSHLLRLLPTEELSVAAGSQEASPSPAATVLGGCPVRARYLQMGRMRFRIGCRGGGPGQLTWPRGIAVGPDNAIVVADSSNHRVQVFDQSGTFVKEFGQYGNGEAEFDCLAGVSVNQIGQYIISDRYNHRIQIFDPSGRFLRAFGQNGTMEGRFNYPWGVTTDALGFIYVCDKENHRVQVFQSDGTFVGTIGSEGRASGQLAHPHYIAVSSTNRVIVTDSNNHRVQVFDVNGRCLTTFGGEGSDDGKFKFPRGVAVDDQGYIIVGDSGNNRIQVFQPDGEFLKAFGCWGNKDGEFKGLEGVAVTSTGNILVCDRENHRIQVF